VSSGSTIEKLGVRVGDIIQHLNGEWVSDTIQLEEMLLRLSEDHFDKGNGLNSTLDIKVGLFHIRNGARNTINLTTVVSENGEVVKRGINIHKYFFLYKYTQIFFFYFNIEKRIFVLLVYFITMIYT
jgi:hypothetical protein